MTGLNAVRDNAARINKCLRCRKRECDNCADDATIKGRPRKADDEVILQMLGEGMTKAQICEELGIATRTYYYCMKRIKYAQANS